MSLRTRIAMLVAGTVLLATLVGGVGTALSSRNVGIDRIDEQLLDDAARIDPTGRASDNQIRLAFEVRRATCNDDAPSTDGQGDDQVAATGDQPATDDDGAGPPPRNPSERFARFLPEFSSSLQLVRSNGVIISGCVVLPVEGEDTDIATTGSGDLLRTVSVDGERYRMLTTGFGDLGALQFARSLELTEDTLRGLFVRTMLFGAIGALLAGLLGWVLARRATQPVERLSEAADRVATTRDLGERITVEGGGEIGTLAASFNTMLASLDTSREQQQRLVQDASHELRTPLTSMRTNVELLQRHTDVPAELRAQVLADISAELAELTELTGELVESATEVDTNFDRSAPFDVANVVEECVERGRRRHRREISLELAHDVETTVVGDGALVARAITNLINNAAKFSDPSSGPIEVVSRGTAVQVLDRGPGIPPDDLPHVFDRFYRATAARSAPGSGLGLSIVKQIVDGHGGQLSAHNREGGGLSIGFTLPSSGPAAVTPTPG